MQNNFVLWGEVSSYMIDPFKHLLSVLDLSLNFQYIYILIYLADQSLLSFAKFRVINFYHICQSEKQEMSFIFLNCIHFKYFKLLSKNQYAVHNTKCQISTH